MAHFKSSEGSFNFQANKRRPSHNTPPFQLSIEQKVRQREILAHGVSYAKRGEWSKGRSWEGRRLTVQDRFGRDDFEADFNRARRPFSNFDTLPAAVILSSGLCFIPRGFPLSQIKE